MRSERVAGNRVVNCREELALITAKYTLMTVR